MHVHKVNCETRGYDKLISTRFMEKVNYAKGV